MGYLNTRTRLAALKDIMAIGQSGNAQSVFATCPGEITW